MSDPGAGPEPMAHVASGEVAVTFLTDGGQSPRDVANILTSFISAARSTLDVAIYDFDPDGEAGRMIADALTDARARGVEVRVAHNVDSSDDPEAPRPAKAAPEVIGRLEIPLRAVREDGALMHNKYIVRDGADVLTGSTNWTDDAFGREENFILVAAGSRELAASYTGNFEHLFRYGHVHGSGGEGPELTLAHDVRVRPYFSPMALGSVSAACIARADRRLRILSPVITSGEVLGRLAEFASRARFDLDGAYDLTQMEEVQRAWESVPHNRWKIEAWKVIAARLSGKRSTPWSPSSTHDFMHAKCVAADDEIVAGSYNLSKHGESNAENVLHIVSEHLAGLFRDFADGVAARYR